MTTIAYISSPTVDSLRETVIGWRRHLHQHPELSFHEEATAQFIADTLAEFGSLEITRPTRTSVVARLVGARPGPVLAIRADIDALPIVEKNTHDFVSRTPGVMHACGHDGHTAMLLGAASAIVRALGADVLGEAVPVMGGEDFSGYQQAAPGAFIFIGARNEERGIVHPHHHEQFDLDERALDYGTRIFVAAALEHLAPRSPSA